MTADPGRRDDKPVFQAATVVLVRDRSDGLETLMLRRNSRLEFAGGMWVFPGGRLDDEDRAGLAQDDVLGASRRAAVREAQEESGLAVDESSLAHFAHWTPPPIAPKRFLTWFFIAPAPEGDVRIDHGEIRDDDWMRPGHAIERRDAGEIELSPPTWVTLDWLAGFGDVAAAMRHARESEPCYFATHFARVDGGNVAMWQGDAGYEDNDPAREGARHRLVMLDTGWRYERS